MLRPDRLDAAAVGLSLDAADARAWLLLFVGLHDLGKATPPFQAQVAERRANLRALGYDFADDHWAPHGELTCPLAASELHALGVDRRFARQVARAVGGHHGVIPSMERTRSLTSSDGEGLVPTEGGGAVWRLAASAVTRAVRACAGLPTVERPQHVPDRPDEDGVRHAFLADLAGLTTTADWMGSNADIFTYVDPPGSVADYWTLSNQRAKECIDRLGWRAPPRAPRRTFEQVFGKKPWPLHAATAVVAEGLSGAAALVVIEAPMGEGKTEAALSVFDHLSEHGSTGLYFALPTQATANQIFGRVKRYLDESFPGETHGLHLVHGDAGLSEAYDALKTEAFIRLRSVDGPNAGASGPVADAWFATSKRALLAPVGVGTIDQALLGVLGVKHGFLRLHGLAGKVVVVDEVHAYDTYTGELLTRLLEWLHALGTTVVLLSATLPRSSREKLARSYRGQLGESPPYPRITVVRDGHVSTTALEARRSPVAVQLVWKDEDALADDLREAIAQGGNVAVIVNTVARAQVLARRLRGLLSADVPVTLLHARFPFAARQAREIQAEASYGPGSTARPFRSVLVGTQVLEQSLDLDFDLMVTDLAPVDLVLQRAGRLHRHAREGRPPGLAAPTLWVLRPLNETRAAGPSFGVSSFVYDEAVLLSSWLALRDRDQLMLPTHIEALVEAVYGDAIPATTPAVLERLAELGQSRRDEQSADANQARRVQLPDPSEDSDPWNGLAQLFEDDDPRVHADLRAKTRLGDASVAVIPMIRVGDSLALFADPAISIPVASGAALPRAVVLALARQSLKIARRGVTHELVRSPVPKAFESSGHLRFHRPLLLDADGTTTVAGVAVRLDEDLGLILGNLSVDDSEKAS
jgi:CRISPR-associated endonuclease/helicase Cas3